MNTVVRTTGLTKVFGPHGKSRRERIAVQDVSLELEAGRCLGIVGESGSGKTTLARMIVGLEEPTGGTIELCGERVPPRKPPARTRRTRARQIQMVFQDPYTSLDRRQTGRHCLDEVLSFHFDLSVAERRDRVDQLADQVGLTDTQIALRPAQLSGGQRQRLAIARSLAVKPQVLVLDEAVSALDVSVQAQVLNCLADIQEQTGTAYLFVSHDLGVIRQIADDVIVMRNGRVVERGQTDKVLDTPSHDYTKLLKASVPGPGWRPHHDS